MNQSKPIEDLIIQLGWTHISVAVILIGILQFLISWWFKYRLQESIKYEYAEKLKDYEFMLKKREQAASIAKLLAEYSYKTKEDNREYVADIWSLSLWLPAPLVCHLTEFLVGKNSEFHDPKDLLIKIRKELHGMDDELKSDQIAHIVSHTDIMNKRSLDKYISEQGASHNERKRSS